MGDTEVVRKGEFVWKIDNFLTSGKLTRESSRFKFGKYDCVLHTSKYNYAGTNFIYNVWFITFNSQPINYKSFCKLCLIDGRGAEFLITKRTTLEFMNSIHFMTISNLDLRCKENNLLTNDVLTLRLSWGDEENSNQEQGTRTASDIISEKEPSKLLQTLSEDFGRFYESKVDTDFSLRVGETLIPVHRAVLSARSEVFAAMFRHDTLENRSGVVDIPDVHASVLNDVLYYVYSGQTRGISTDTVIPMYVVADKYGLIELRDTCLDVLMRSLAVENICDAALLAHTHGETKLEEKVVLFVKEKMEEIEETDKWKEFFKSKPSLAAKLLRSALKIYKDEVKKLSSK